MGNSSCPRNIQSYQSANLTDNEIIKSFIVRKKEFERIIAEIKRDDMSGSIQHFILVGRRGSGKSTLLRRIQAEVNRTPELSEKLIVVNLSEEQAGIYRLHDLWDLIIRSLNTMNIPVSVTEWNSISFEQTEYSKALYASIQKTLKLQNKKLLLLLDNIDRIFENIGDDAHLLRELLTNHKDLRIIGGSVRMSEHYWKYNKPFYEFFRIIRLESLTRDEVGELLTYWSSCMNLSDVSNFLKNNPGKIETIRLLTDGMPRTLLNFLEILIDRNDQKGYEYLRLIIDHATPVYQERLNYLPPAQRKVIIELANYWDAVKVNQLIETCKMPGKVISAQLNQLEKNEIVEKIPGLKREHLYRLTERFFNLWLLMTQGGPKEKRQVKYLTVFLENWYDETELQSLYNQHLFGIEQQRFRPDYAALMTSALSHSKCLTLEQRDIVIEKTRSIKDTIKDYLDLIPPTSDEILKKVEMELLSGDYKKARTTLNTLEQDHYKKNSLLGLSYMQEGEYNLAENHFLAAYKNGDESSILALANLYFKSKRLGEAEKYTRLALSKGYDSALFNLALIYNLTNRLKEAEKYYLLACEKGDVDAFYNLALLYNKLNRIEDTEKYLLLAYKHGFVESLNTLSYLYRQAGRFEEAEKYLLLAIDKGDENALFNLAKLYSEIDQIENAEKYYLLAIEKGNVNAINNLAGLYWNTNRLDEAEKYAKLAVDRGEEKALNNLAYLYSETQRFKEAEKYYLMAIEKGNTDGLHYLAELYQKTQRFDYAEKYFLLAIEEGNLEVYNNIAIFYYEMKRYEYAEKYFLLAIEKENIKALNNLAGLYDEIKRYEDAEKYFLLAIEKGHVNAMVNLANLYFKTERFDKAEKYYLLSMEHGAPQSFFNLLNMYYTLNINKKRAITLIRQIENKTKDQKSKSILSIALLWTGQMDDFEIEVNSIIPELIESSDSFDLMPLMFAFLVHKQYKFAWSWFKNPIHGEKLKEMIKPLYYLTAEFIKGQEEEALKPGPEIEENISEIREEILKQQAFYYPDSVK
ncbi:MAG: tetratricopeptide repeat protein [Bacteroidota bacterium]